MAALEWVATLNNTDFIKSQNQLLNSIEQTNRAVEQSGLSIEKYMDGLKAKAAALAAGFSAEKLARQIMSVRGEFQQLEIAFTTILGSAEKANSLMQQLTKTAAITPFDLQGVANGAKQLLSYGIEAEKVNDTLIHLGDIAAGLSLPLSDLVYLYGTTMVQGRMFTQDLRQFQGRGIPIAEELAKVLGVAKDKVGELVTAGKVGAKEFDQAIMAMSSEGGKFGGLMEAQSKTITGQISNIEDAVDVMLNNIGKQSEGVINGALSVAAELVENYEEVGKVLLDVGIAYGAYKATLLGCIAVEQVAAYWKGLTQEAAMMNTLANAGETASVNALTVAKLRLTAATKELTAGMLANPYIAIGAAVATLGVVVYNAATATNALDKAHERLNEKAKETEAGVLEEINRLDSLNRKLQECEKGSDEYKKVKQTIIDQYGQYYSGLEAEIDKVGSLAGVYDQLTDAIRRSIGARNLKSFYDQEMDNYDKLVAGKLNKAYKELKDKYGDAEGTRLYHNVYQETVLGKNGSLSADDMKKLRGVSFWDVRWGKNARTGLVDFRASVDDLRADILDAKAASDKVLQEYKDMYEISEEEWNKALFGSKTTSGGTNPTTGGSGNKTHHISKDDAADREAKAVAQQLQQADELRRLAVEAEDARREATIAAIENDGERERAERKAQHEKTVREIEAQEAEAYKAIYERRKQAYEAAHKGDPDGGHYENTEAGKAGWQGVKGTLNAEETEYFKLREAAWTAALEKENAEYGRWTRQRYAEEAQAMRDFLKEYGTYEEQRLAITQEYEEKIRKAQTPSEAAGYALQRDEDIKNLEAQKLQDDIDWQGVFSDLQGHTQEYLIGLRDQLQGLLDEGELPVDQMATIQEKIRAINGEISKQNGLFKFQGDRAREHQRLLEQEDHARKRLEEYQKEQIVNEQAVAEATKNVRDFLDGIAGFEGVDIDEAENLLAQFDPSSEEYKQAKELLTTLKISEGQLAESRKKTEKATKDAKNAEDAAKRDSAQAVADWFSDAQQFIAEKGIDQIPDLLNEIGLGSIGEKVSQGLSAFNNAAGAAADFASGNYVGAALKAVSAVKDVVGMFGSDNTAKMQKKIDELNNHSDALAMAMKSLQKAFENAYGADAMKNAEEQRRLLENQQKDASLAMDYEAQKHGKWRSSLNTSVNDNKGWQDAMKVVSQILGKTVKRSQDFLSLSAADMQKIIDYDGGVTWNKILNEYRKEGGTGGRSDQLADMLKDYVEQFGDAFDELDEMLSERLTGTTKENVFDDFLNSLYELADGSEDVMDDIAENWQKMVNRMVVNNLIASDFQEKLGKWYEDLTELQERRNGGMSDEEYERELSALKGRYDDLFAEAQGKVEEFTELGIIKPMADAADEVDELLESMADSVKSAFEDLLGDPTQDIEEWGKSLRQTLARQLVANMVLTEEFEEWAKQWSERYANVWKNHEEGYMPDQVYGKQRDALMAELAGMTDDVAARARSLWESFGDGLLGEGDETFKGLADSWASALTDMDKTAEDWAGEIGRTMAGRIVEEMVAPTLMQPLLDELQRAVDAAMGAEGATWESVVGDAGIQGALAAIQAAYPELQAVVRGVMDGLGVVAEASTPFDGLRDTFLDTLADLEGDAESFRKKLEETLVKDLLEKQVLDVPLTVGGKEFEDFDAYVSDWNRRYRDALAGGDTGLAEGLLDELVAVREQTLAAAEELRERLRDVEKDTTFEDMGEQWASALAGMEKDADAWADDVRELLLEKLVKQLTEQAGLQKFLDSYQEAVDAVLEGTGSQEEKVEALLPLVDEWAAKYEELLPLVERLRDALGLGEQVESPFGSLRDSFVSTLMDMEASTEDFAKSISETITEAFIDRFVLGDAFDDKLKGWEQEYARIMEDDSLSDEARTKMLRELTEAIGEARDSYTARAEEIMSLMGLSTGTEDQGATMNMAEAATYDQFELYLGIATAQQMCMEQQRDIQRQILSTLETMLAVTSPGEDYGQQIFNRLKVTNDYLLSIKSSNQGILDTVSRKLDLINANLSRL